MSPDDPTSDDDDQSFTSATSHHDDRFSPEEEASLLSTSNTLKASANSFFAHGDYTSAIQTYDRALSSCPLYLSYETAVLNANIAACHIKLADWKEAIDCATKSIEALETLDPLPKAKKKTEDLKGRGESEESGGAVVELDDEDVETMERAERALGRSGRTRDEVQRLRVKAFLRRAKARMETGGWASLQGAQEDYAYLVTDPNLSPLDRKTVQASLRELAPRLDDAKSKEMAEMMGKLKGLGNSILKPFGLSTDNFQFVKDEKTGGYNMNFNQK